MTKLFHPQYENFSDRKTDVEFKAEDVLVDGQLKQVACAEVDDDKVRAYLKRGFRLHPDYLPQVDAVDVEIIETVDLEYMDAEQLLNYARANEIDVGRASKAETLRDKIRTAENGN